MNAAPLGRIRKSAKQTADLSLQFRQCGAHNAVPRTPAAGAQSLMNSKFNRNRRWQSIGELTLPPGAGKLNPVEPKGHQTWWPAQDFDPVNNCKVIL